MSVDYHRLPSVLGSPVVSDGQTELVGLARRLTVLRKRANLARAPTLHLLLHARMRCDQLAVIEDVVTHEVIEKVAHLLPELGGFCFELRDGVGETMRELDVAAPKLAHQLHVVVPRDTVGRLRLDHGHRDLEDLRDPRAAVHEVAEEYGLPSGRVPPHSALVYSVSELREQLLQLVATAVHVADEVERPVVGLAVVPQELALDLDRFDVLGRLENEDVPKSFLLKVS